MGVDIGSQSVKALLLDPDGREVASAGHGAAMSHPASGWAEQDPAQWRDGLAATVRQLITASSIAPAEVTHLGLASQVDGVVPVDRSLRPIRPAIIWLDRRASAQADAPAGQRPAPAPLPPTRPHPPSPPHPPPSTCLRARYPPTPRA